MTSAGFAELILKPVADLRSTFLEKITVLSSDIADNLQEVQREVLQFSRVLEQLEKFWEKCNKALRIQLTEY